jgi:benzylsuccinate CoA-transferase BbsE subunit
LLGCYKVLDCSDRLGWLAGRMLVDLGADVVKIEPTGAEPSSAAWRAFNVGKQVLALDLGERRMRGALERLIAAADVLIETAQPGEPLAEFYDPARLAALNPRLVHVSVTPFGRSGPRAGWQASDLELMAAGGLLSLAGDPQGEPVRVSEPQSYCWAGAQAAVGALMALFHRGTSGKGQHVDVSAQASILAALAHAPTFVDLLGVVPQRSGAYMTGRSVTGARYRVFWPCADGYINFILYGGAAGRRTNERLVSWMSERGIAPGPLAAIAWDKFDATRLSQEEIDALEAPIAEFFGSLTKREFLEGANRREMLGYPVFEPADIADDPQLEARGFWQNVASESGAERHCGAFAIFDGVRPQLRAASRAVDLPEVLARFGISASEGDARIAADERAAC